MIKTLVTADKITDELARQLNDQHESQVKDDEILEGEVVDDRSSSAASTPAYQSPSGSKNQEEELRSRIISGEWDNLDTLPAFAARTPEGQLMARTEAIDYRIKQLEERLPMLLNQYLHDSYVQVLKKIRALRRTKAGLFYLFYKTNGQRDLNAPEDHH